MLIIKRQSDEKNNFFRYLFIIHSIEMKTNQDQKNNRTLKINNDSEFSFDFEHEQATIIFDQFEIWMLYPEVKFCFKTIEEAFKRALKYGSK